MYTLAGTPERPCRNAADVLAVPARYALHQGFQRNEDKSLAGTRQNSGRISVKHAFIMTTVYSARGPPGTKIQAALTARTG